MYILSERTRARSLIKREWPFDPFIWHVTRVIAVVIKVEGSAHATITTGIWLWNCRKIQNINERARDIDEIHSKISNAMQSLRAGRPAGRAKVTKAAVCASFANGRSKTALVADAGRGTRGEDEKKYRFYRCLKRA